MLDTLLHTWLRLPYLLNVWDRRWPKKPKATLVFLHGLGNSGAAWNPVIKHLPENVRILSVDLLGFGDSPKPSKARYDARIQARAVATTLAKQLPRGKCIIVGHSMGSLVAVELAKLYPWLVRSLILCSPPFYHSDTTPSPTREAGLKKLYRLIHTHPEQFARISALAKKYKITNGAFELNEKNITSYMSALEASIINQTSFDDAVTLKQPTTIIHGRLDPVVIKKNLVQLTRLNASIRLKMVAAAHEIRTKNYTQAVVATIEEHITAVKVDIK